MRRFITYLYAYEGGRKDRNAGFIRVNERNGQVAMQVSTQGELRGAEKGAVYGLVRQGDSPTVELEAVNWSGDLQVGETEAGNRRNGLQGILLGEVNMQEPHREVVLRFLAENAMDSGYRLDDFVGIGICFPGGEYFASCWRDDMAEEIARWNAEAQVTSSKMTEGEENGSEMTGSETTSNEMTELVEAEAQMVEQTAELHAAVEEAQATEPVADSGAASVKSEPFPAIPTTYRKISLTDIHSLPSPNWHLCNNSFLVHGFFNYHYLIIKKVVEADGEKLYLGVPGFFEKQEAVMALLFGFPEFEALPQEVVERREQNSQPPQTGVFGCWLVPLASDRAQ